VVKPSTCLFPSHFVCPSADTQDTNPGNRFLFKVAFSVLKSGGFVDLSRKPHAGNELRGWSTAECCGGVMDVSRECYCCLTDLWGSDGCVTGVLLLFD
jgi:hypothetical protein